MDRQTYIVVILEGRLVATWPVNLKLYPKNTHGKAGEEGSLRPVLLSSDSQLWLHELLCSAAPTTTWWPQWFSGVSGNSPFPLLGPHMLFLL